MGREGWEPSKHARLCDLHFEEDCLIRGESHTCLTPTAVPTRFFGDDNNVPTPEVSAAEVGHTVPPVVLHDHCYQYIHVDEDAIDDWVVSDNLDSNSLVRQESQDDTDF